MSDTTLSIHSESSIRYYKEELEADQWVMETLKYGYKIPFTSVPPKYHEPNNQSAVKHHEFLWKKIKEWESRGFCVRTQKEPYCCNPLSVAEKLDLKKKETKLRVCMDFSRHVNLFIPDQPVKLSHLHEAEKLLEKGDWQTSFDLENMYFHVRINEAFQKYFGFSITSPEKKILYYIFKVMIYGIKSGVLVATKLTKPIVKKSNLLGIRFSIFIDDGRVLGKDKQRCERNLDQVLEIMEKAGWKVNEAKTIRTGSKSLYHQGMITCTDPMMYILPQFKMDHIMEWLEFVLNKQVVQAKDLARVVGMIVSGIKALGPIAKVLLRSSHMLLAEETNNFQIMNVEIRLTYQVQQELYILKDKLRELNGQPIILEKTGVCFQQVLEFAETESKLPFSLKENKQEPEVVGVFRGLLPDEELLDIMASDSSDFQEYGYSLLEPKNVHVRKMTTEESEESSGKRELGAILNYFKENMDKLYQEQPAIIYWLTDSMNVCYWLDRGSRKPLVQKVVVELLEI